MSDNQGPVEPLQSSTASRGALERLLGGGKAEPTQAAAQPAYQEPISGEVAAQSTTCPNCASRGEEVELEEDGACATCGFSKAERLF